MAIQVTTGVVRNGQILVDGVHLDEGARVAVLSPDAGETVVLSSDQEDALIAALAEVERGEFVGLDDLLASLPEPVAAWR